NLNFATPINSVRRLLAHPTPMSLTDFAIANDSKPAHTCRSDAPQDCAIQCERGSVSSCAVLSGLLLQAKDYAKALSFATKACDGGQAAACTTVGRIYENGNGVGQDIGKATDLYRRSCEGGAAIGCGYFADMVESGRGVTADPQRAVTLRQRACDMGRAA